MKSLALPLLAISLVSATPAAAQNTNVDNRVDRLEQEMRAVQRKVFPGASGRFFEPEITPDAGDPAAPSTTTSAVTDLIARVDALERSLASITGQVEQNGFRLKQLEDKMAMTEAETTDPESSAAAETAARAEPAAAPAPDPERVAGVAAIIMPDTGDAGEDAYIYGYRLWEAKYYPEAQAQLKKTVKDHPDHRRASFAQNLLGRAYLDDGKPALASVELYKNYQEKPRGDRAADSLYYLSTALVQLNKKTDACRVLAELQDVYPATADGRLSGQIESGKKNANCK